MISFIRFGIKEAGGMFIASELLFLLDIIAIIFFGGNLLLGIGVVMLGLYNVIMLIEYIGERTRVKNTNFNEVEEREISERNMRNEYGERRIR